MAERRLLTLTETEWLRCLRRFLAGRDHRIGEGEAAVTTSSGTLRLSWRRGPSRNLGRLRLPTLELVLDFDGLPSEKAALLDRALDLATRRGGG